MKASDQKARIFDTWIEKVDGKITADGEPYYMLKAKAYTVKNDENKSFIEAIDAGIKKEVSISCSSSTATCSICGKTKGKADASIYPAKNTRAKLPARYCRI